MSRRIVVAQGRRRMDPVAMMMISGMLGGVVGFTIWMVTEAFVFLPVFLAAGLVSGISIAEARHRK